MRVKQNEVITLLDTYSCVPDPERGRPFHFDIHRSGDILLNFSRRTVYMRSFSFPLRVDTYSGHSHPVSAAKFSPNGCYVASADVSGKVHIWATDNEDHTLQAELHPWTGPVFDISWSPDGQRLALCGEGREYFAQVLLLTGGKVGEIGGGHSRAILSCDFRPCRPFRIVTASEDTLVNFYDGPPFKFSSSSRVHSRFANCVRFSPDGKYFASVGGDKKIFIYDGKTGEMLFEMTQGVENGHLSAVYSCSWTPDSKYLLTSSADKSCALWDVEKCQVVRKYLFGETISDMQQGCLCKSSSEFLSISLSGQFNLFSRDETEQIHNICGHSKSITALCMDEENGKLISGSYDGRVVVWEKGIGAGKIPCGNVPTNQICQLQAVGDTLFAASLDGTVKSGSLSQGRFYDEELNVSSSLVDMDVWGNGDLITVITASDILVFKNRDMKISQNVSYQPTAVSVSSDGTRIAVGGKNDCSVHVYGIGEDSLEEIMCLGEHRGDVTDVAFSPDGEHIASCDGNREVIIFNASSGEREVRNWVYHSARVTCLAWASDSIHLATGSLDSGVIVWDREEPRTRRTIEAVHIEGVTKVAFFGTDILVSGGTDGCLRTWKI